MSEVIPVLPGDGIGPEVTEAAKAVLNEFGGFEFPEYDIGGIAIDRHGTPLPEATLRACTEARAVLLGAVGGPKWENPSDPEAPRPEQGLLGLRKAMEVHANVRPIYVPHSLAERSSFKEDLVRGTNFVIVRELLGGVYFGDSGRDGDTVYDTYEYSPDQVRNIGRTTFGIALDRAGISGREPEVISMDKADEWETSRLWREVMGELQEAEYPEVSLRHMLVKEVLDELSEDPTRLDVVVTENMLGDIFSDAMAGMTGSIGVLPSASLSREGPGLFEPVHGSAPGIAGKGEANPTAMFLSTAMMLDKLGRHHQASAVRWAVDGIFKRRIFTPDLGGNATTEDVTAAVVRDVHNFAARQ